MRPSQRRAEVAAPLQAPRSFGVRPRSTVGAGPDPHRDGPGQDAALDQAGGLDLVDDAVAEEVGEQGPLAGERRVGVAVSPSSRRRPSGAGRGPRGSRRGEMMALVDDHEGRGSAEQAGAATSGCGQGGDRAR